MYSVPPTATIRLLLLLAITASGSINRFEYSSPVSTPIISALSFLRRLILSDDKVSYAKLEKKQAVHALVQILDALLLSNVDAPAI